MGDFDAAAANTIADGSAASEKRSEWHDAARKKHTHSLRAVAESMQLARETAHTLSMQSGECFYVLW